MNEPQNLNGSNEGDLVVKTDHVETQLNTGHKYSLAHGYDSRSIKITPGGLQ